MAKLKNADEIKIPLRLTKHLKKIGLYIVLVSFRAEYYD